MKDHQMENRTASAAFAAPVCTGADTFYENRDARSCASMGGYVAVIGDVAVAASIFVAAVVDIILAIPVIRWIRIRLGTYNRIQVPA